VWSFGCVIYEMCCFDPPFKGKDFKALYKKIMTGIYMRIPIAYSNNLSTLIAKCLIVNSKKRASVDELLEMN
jgi:NIMA (never in mitosis gene a)-related kinase